MKALKAFIKLFDTPQANQLTGFYMSTTLAFNGLIRLTNATPYLSTYINSPYLPSKRKQSTSLTSFKSLNLFTDGQKLETRNRNDCIQE